MRISDWSSDVCSSDLARGLRRTHPVERRRHPAAARDGVGIGGRPLEADDSAPDARRQFDPARLDRVDILPLAQGRGQGDVGDRMLDAVVEQRQRQGYIVRRGRSEEQTSELQSLMRTTYA